jgi:hypothetical protein
MSNFISPVFRILLPKMTNLPYAVRVQTHKADSKLTKFFRAQSEVGHVEA